MHFGSLDVNNLVLMVIAVMTLANTVMVGINARQSILRTALAKQTNNLAADTKIIAQRTEVNTNSLVAKLVSAEKQVSHAEGVAEEQARKTP